MRYLIAFTLLFMFSNHGFSTKVNPDPKKLFLEFWEFVDKNYIYFEAKKIDWNKIYLQYSSKIDSSTSEDALFELMDAAILELKDGHSIIVKDKKIGSQYNIKNGYEIHFDAQLVKTNYVKDSLGQSGNLYWALLKDNIGYVYLPAFNDFQSFEQVFRIMKEKNVKKLIIDVRGNGGGNSNPVPELLGILVKEKTLLGSYIEKNGPKHADVTKPIGMFAVPNPSFHFDIPIDVLINRSCYSATSYFAGMIKGLPKVRLVGQLTGGGAGGHLGYQLSNGAQLRVSVSDFLDKEGNTVETGVLPDIFIENTAEDIRTGRDKMLEKAMEL